MEATKLTNWDDPPSSCYTSENMEIMEPPGTRNIHLKKWLFQLDDSKPLHKKWWFHQTSI